MSISPWYVGATNPAWTPQILDDSGAVVNLTGGTLALAIYNVSSGVETVGAGAWTLVDAANGKAKYAWNAADVATAGSYRLYVKVTGLPGGTLECDPVAWEVLPT